MMNISFSIFWNPVSFNFHTNFHTMKGARSEVSFFTRPSDLKSLHTRRRLRSASRRQNVQYGSQRIPAQRGR